VGFLGGVVIRDVHVSLQVQRRYVDCLVEPDGTVRVWDAVGDIYSIHHALTPAQEREAQRLAGH
jgi:hypothetical protein